MCRYSDIYVYATWCYPKMPLFQKTSNCLTVALVSVRPRSNNLTSNFIHHVQRKMLLTFTLTHCTVMSSTSNTHHFSLSQYVFWSHESQLHSPSPHLPILYCPTPSPPHYLCSLTIYNTTQGAHGLDGRPGPVVSGANPALVPSPSHPSPAPLLPAPPPSCSLPAVCFSCLLAWSLPISFLSLFCK